MARPYRYQGKIKFDVPGANQLEAAFASGGAGKGSTPDGDWPITQFVPHTGKYDLQGFALNDVYGKLPDPDNAGGRSDIMLHLDKKGRQLDKIKSLGCLSVQEKDWPALRDEIIGLQKQGMSLVAHVDSATGEVTIRQAGSTAATPVASASAFADATKATQAPIKQLQESLASAGFSPGKADGVSGPKTVAAIKAFQQANGLKVDGIVGPQTATVLAATSGASGAKETALQTLAAKATPVTPTLQSDNSLSHISQITGLTADERGASGLSAVNDGGFGAAQDPRTAALLGLARGTVGASPDASAAPGASVAFQGSLALPGAPSAPTPMPGRPAGLDASQVASTASPVPAAAHLVRLPSGKMIAVGTVASNDGKHSVVITDDGHGNAVLSHPPNIGEIPGVIDPTSESGKDTVAGPVVKNLIDQAKETAALKAAGLAPAASDAATAAKDFGAKALDQSFGGVGSKLGAAFGPGVSGVANAFNSLFGGKSSASPGEPALPASNAEDRERNAPISEAATRSEQKFARNPVPEAKSPAEALKDVGAWATPANQLAPKAVSAPVPSSGFAGQDVYKTVNVLNPDWKPSPTTLGQESFTSTGEKIGRNLKDYMTNVDGAVQAPIIHPAATAPAPSSVPKFVTKRVLVGKSGGQGQGQDESVAPTSAQKLVTLASGKTVPVGTRGTSSGGAYQFEVQDDGSVKNLKTGKISAPAKTAVASQSRTQQAQSDLRDSGMLDSFGMVK